MHKKQFIWNKTIPYNTGKSKYIKMKNIGKPDFDEFQICIGNESSSNRIISSINGVTQKMELELEDGYKSFNDVPYVIPYLVKESKVAVIVVPGGGYAYKSYGEGVPVAEALNERGISAFVLSYRLNPYREPVPWIDLQRAVRYIKYNAKRYDISPDRIGVLGFSAGGHVCASLLCLLRNGENFSKGYKSDVIDNVESSVAFAGLIYPVINLNYNQGILFALTDEENLKFPVDKERILEKLNPTYNISKFDPPQFLSYGTKDTLVNPKGVLEYKRKLEIENVPYRLLEVENATHGFADCSLPDLKLQNNKYSYWLDEFVLWIKDIGINKIENDSSL